VVPTDLIDRRGAAGDGRAPGHASTLNGHPAQLNQPTNSPTSPDDRKQQQDLLAQSSHHSEKVRKDALSGLQQLLTAHPTEARRHAAALLEKLAARLSDGDQGVRDALLLLLRLSVFPALGAATLAPFIPMLMAHLEAAMTHLEAPVRLDALGVLEALAAAAPAAFAPGMPLLAPCLCHYSTLLSRTHRGRSVKAQALSGLSKVVASLRRFLASVLPADKYSEGGESAAAVAAAAAAAADEAAGGVAAAPLMAQRCAWGGKPEAVGPAQLLAIYAGPAAAAAAVTQQLQQQQAPVQQQQKKQQPQPQQQQQVKPHKAVSKKRKQHIEPGTAQEEQAPAAAAGTASTPTAAITATAAAAGPTAATVRRGSGMAVAQAAGLQLLTSLAACWRECAPATLSTSPELESAQALVNILVSSSLLVPGLRLLPSPADSGSSNASAMRQAELAAAAAGALLPIVVAVFPITAPAARPPAAVQDLMVEFNVAAAQLLGSFLAAGVAWPARPDRASPAELAWGGTLLRYIQGVLLTGVALPAANALSAHITLSATPAPGATAAASTPVVLPLLRTLERLLPRLVPADRAPLLGAVSALAGAQPQQKGAGGGAGGGGGRSGPIRASCLRLQRDLLLRHLQEGGADAAAASDMAGWLRAAPKALWGLGDRSPGSSRVLLSMLYHTARLGLPGSPLVEALSEVQPQLSPLLCTALAPPQAAAAAVSAPSSKKAKKPQVPAAAAAPADAAAVQVLIGPLARLPAPIQCVGADLLSLLSPLHPSLVRSVALAARLSSFDDAFVSRLLDGVLTAAPGSVTADVYLQLLATLLAPRAGAALVAHGAGAAAAAGAAPLDAGFGRHRLVVDCVCRWLHRFGPPAELVGVLEDCLVEQWEQLETAGGGGGGGSSAGPGARSVAYSIVSAASLAAGSWVAPDLVAAAAAGRGEAAEGAADESSGSGAAAAAQAIPARLLQVLPAAMCEQLASAVDAAVLSASPSSAVDNQSGSGGSSSSGSDAALSAAAAAAAESVRQLLAQLLVSTPDLTLPFLQLLVGRATGDGSSSRGNVGGKQQRAVTAAAVDPARLAAAIEAVEAALSCRALLPWWLQRENEAAARALVDGLSAAAAARQQAVGDARCVGRAERLAAVLSGLCAR
jgi:pre-rRNA-processing protein IPI1